MTLQRLFVPQMIGDGKKECGILDMRLEGRVQESPAGCSTGKKKTPVPNTEVSLFSGGPSETRTPNQLIKSQLLYQLS